MSKDILLSSLIRKAVEMMEQSGNMDADIDAWLLAEEIFGINRAKYFMNPHVTVEKEAYDRFMQLVDKRCHKIPLQYLTGRQEFMGFSFYVNENVLIPRQDTELLVEKVLEVIDKHSEIKILDMCTGSGCIGISIKKLRPNTKVTAADLSEKALGVARKNGANLKAEVKFVQSDLFEKINEKYDIIVSNPPYIRKSDILTLMDEVREHEPLMALDGDEDGLKFYRDISSKLNEFLNDGGLIFYEIGYDQGETVPDILKANNFMNINVYKDLSGNDRVVTGRKGEKNV